VRSNRTPAMLEQFEELYEREPGITIRKAVLMTAIRTLPQPLAKDTWRWRSTFLPSIHSTSPVLHLYAGRARSSGPTAPSREPRFARSALKVLSGCP
jgi:hypothetical protein